MSEAPMDPTNLPIFGGDTYPQALNGHTASPTAQALAGRVTVHPSTPPLVHHAPLDGSDPAALPTYLDLPSKPSGPRGTQSTGPVRPAAPTGPVDWKQIAVFRVQASNQLTAALGDQRGVDEETERELGRAIIQELLQTTAAERLQNGELGWTLDDQDALATAVFDALFGLGRLQPLVDDDTVENIIIAGAADVWVEKTDGMLVKVDPVADSDQELLDFLSFVATRSEANARSFSSATPRLHMRLDGGSRLAAAAWVTAYPSVVIRRHRLRRVTLNDLVDRNMITPNQATFLKAAIKARKSVVVAGAQGAGKTTLLRALAAEINPWEAIGTFETEFELHLHELKDVHPIVHAWEARPGSGEIGPDGRRAGEFTIDEALYDSFRFNLSRQIVGEVRGREVWAMIKAMESDAGSISTTHARDGEAAIRKLVTCAMEAGAHVTRELATSKLADTIDIIVQVNLETVPLGDDKWRRSRWVSEILHVAPGEKAKGYATTHIYLPNPRGGPAVPGILPDELQALEQFGFDLGGYLAEDGQQEMAE